jgi:hypothetical protein
MTDRRDGLLEESKRWGDIRVGSVLVPGHRRHESWEVIATTPGEGYNTGWMRIKNLATGEEKSVAPQHRAAMVVTLTAPTKFPEPPRLAGDDTPAAALVSERLGAALVGVIDNKTGEVWAPWPVGDVAIREHLAELHGIASESTSAAELAVWHIRAHQEERFNGARAHKHARLEDFTESSLTS